MVKECGLDKNGLYISGDFISGIGLKTRGYLPGLQPTRLIDHEVFLVTKRKYCWYSSSRHFLSMV